MLLLSRWIADNPASPSASLLQTFATFVLLDLSSALQSRGLLCPLTANRPLLLTCSASFLSLLGLIYIPWMQGVFQTEALASADLLRVLGMGAGSLALHEGRRVWERKREREELMGLGGGGGMA